MNLISYMNEQILKVKRKITVPIVFGADADNLG